MPNKPPANGPGRATSRARAVARPTGAAPAGKAPGQGSRTARGGEHRTRRVVRPDEQQAAAATETRPGRRFQPVGFTRRAVAFLVVVAILVVSYASSLRVYLRQERELATAQQQIAERTAANANLEYEIQRWKDPEFVKAQARQRLGWVVPGEIGFRVVDANGQPIGGGATISSTSTVPEGEHATAWWDRLAGSIAAADEPLVASPSAPATVGPFPSPSPSASSTPTKKS